MLSGYSFFLFAFLMGMFFLSFYRYHFMIVMLGLEFLMLTLFYMMGDSLLFLGGGLDLLVMFLVMVVVEGAFGLSLLVMYGVFIGGDWFGSFRGF